MLANGETRNKGKENASNEARVDIQLKGFWVRSNSLLFGLSTQTPKGISKKCSVSITFKLKKQGIQQKGVGKPYF